MRKKPILIILSSLISVLFILFKNNGSPLFLILLLAFIFIAVKL